MKPVLNIGDKSVPVKITVIRGNNLRGNKSDNFHNYVRVEFNGVVLGDSPKKEDVSVEQGVDYDFTCSFDCSDTAHTLDNVAHKPVILTVIEILPKEKKQKVEKEAVLGQATVDLLPLLHGQCSFSSTVLLHPASSSLGEVASQETSSKPSLDVSVSIPEPLLSETQLAGSNLLKVTVETAYSVPEVWNLDPGPGLLPFTYAAAMQVPLTAEKQQALMFPGGLLKAGGDREAAGRPLAVSLAQGAQVLPGVSIQKEPIELEDGELTGIEDREFRKEAETSRKRVSWDTEQRCFLDAGGAASLSQRIGESRLWPVEIMRSSVQGSKGGKASRPLAEDDQQLSFHGVVYVDMGPLLYPGATRIRGAYRVHPFSEADLLAKTKRTASVLKEQARPPASQVKQRANSAVGSCKMATSKTFDGSHKGPKDIKEMPRKVNNIPGGQGRPTRADSVTDVEPPVNAEGQMYVDARTYIIIEISLEKPLVPKRPPEELAKRVNELIPPRPPLPRRPAGAERAVQEFQNQVTSVVGQLLDQYQELFGPAFLHGAKPLDPSTQEQHKRQLLGELNYSGKFFALKEQMKYSVVRIVREKMLRTEAFSDPEQLRAFLSQLYVFLVDHMHLALSKTLSVDTQDVAVQPRFDSSQLRHFAREAQLYRDYYLAAQYYQELVVREPTEPSHWFDYGSFYMLTGDHLKAEECFHHAVSIQQSHQPSLMMCGVLAQMGERYSEAQTYLERATCLDPTSVVAWTLSGLLHQGQNNSIQAEMSFLEAGRQLRATVVPGAGDTAGEPPLDEDKQEDQEGEQEEEEEDATPFCPSPTVQPEAVDQEGEGEREPGTRSRHAKGSGAESSPPRLNTTIYMETVQFLLQSNALQMAQRALSQELLYSDGGLSSSYRLSLARLQLLRADYCSAASNLREALNDGFQEPDAWALYGHCHYLTGELRKAQECYERSLEFLPGPSDTHPVYLRLGTIYIHEGKFESAKTNYLRACKSSPSCLTWLGLGISCYRLEEMSEAEDALTEANTLNNMNPEVWGYLALVCLKSGRTLEAEQSYKYVIKLNLQEESILKEIKELQDHLGYGNPSF
ncbi:cilia- and flagella-associated protein 70 [Polymixia lowei]